nr:MAG TPA: hypothetical protein [Caudoviricetes sp.]
MNKFVLILIGLRITNFILKLVKKFFIGHQFSSLIGKIRLLISTNA